MNLGLLVFAGLGLMLAAWRGYNVATTDSDDDMAPPPLVGDGDLYVSAVGYVKGVAHQITLMRIANGLYLRQDAAEAYNRMMADCPGGANPQSGYRSNEQQDTLYKMYKAGTGNLAAPPGYSNHQDGTAVDENNINPDKTLVYNNEKDEWLRDNCAQYGWKRAGLSFGEPWHMEYTG